LPSHTRSRRAQSLTAIQSTHFVSIGDFHAKGKITCGFPGQVSEIEWLFVERRNDKDVYRFTRRFPSDTPATSTTHKTVEFSDTRVVVFEDQKQATIIEVLKK